MKKLTLLLILFAFQSKAQIKPFVMANHVYYRTELKEIVFFKHGTQYFLLIECDGKDSTAKNTQIIFDSQIYFDSSFVDVSKEKYILTYNYSTIIKMDQALINLFLNQSVKTIKIGNGSRKINSGEYKRILRDLINYKEK